MRIIFLVLSLWGMVSSIHAQDTFSPFKKSVSRSNTDEYSFDKSFIQELHNRNLEEFTLDLVVRNEPYLLSFQKSKLESPSFKIESTDGTVFNHNTGSKFFNARNENGETEAILNVYRDYVLLILYSKEGHYQLYPSDIGYKGLLVSEASANHIRSNFCAVSSREILPEAKQNLNTPKIKTSRSKLAGTDCAGIHFYVDRHTYDDFGGNVADIRDWVSSLFNTVKSFYSDIDVDLMIQALTIEMTTDDFASASGPSAALDILITKPMDGMVAHLLTTRPYMGGVAYINVLCDMTYGYGVSGGLSKNITTPPDYSWSTEVVTHELGHNFGSNHTHDCVWNGNDTRIDYCGPVAGYVGKTRERVPCNWDGTSTLPTGGGTIMSYCHLTSAGINFSKGFHEQVATVIKNNFNSDKARACKKPCAEELALPVEYLSIEAESNKTSIEVIWETGEEVNCDYYVVLHSEDGIAFKPIGDKKAKNGSGRKKYSFVHDKVNHGTNYYRLRQYDYDGANSLSPIVIAKSGISAPKFIFTNSELRFSSPKNFRSKTVRIYNQLGQVVFEKDYSGVNSIVVNTGSFVSSIYYAEVAMENKIFRKRFFR